MAVLILDKSALRGCGASKLRDLAASHSLLLPHILWYEIITEEPAKCPDPHSHYILKLAGLSFQVCRSLRDLIREEIQSRKPASTIIDEESTTQLLQALQRPAATWPRREDVVRPEDACTEADEVITYRKKQADRLSASSQLKELSREVAEFAKHHNCNHARALVIISRDVAIQVWTKTYPVLQDLACEGSVTFMDVWLRNYIELRRHMHANFVGEKALLNEAFDNDYLVLLAAADGLISGDGEMLEKAKAFFPDKIYIDSRMPN
ncbi:MAG: hypothetical protein NTX87_07125 [Planctomycetota bacterium]|nr:hypothetical protein [Planctomycetota bacterium]